MYITITAQKLDNNYPQSVGDFVAYLEKENENVHPEEMEYFFNQHGDRIEAQQVINEIDNNTSKLKQREPKFYSIMVSPSQHELKKIENNDQFLKTYTRELMKDYVSSFNREIDGKPVTVNDVMYFAKIENQRTYKGTDKQIRENQPYASEILKLKLEIRKIERGELKGSIPELEKQINKLEKEAPHQQNGKRIVQGMKKDGHQGHIHIIVSRKDVSNSVSLSPGSKYKASEVTINGKLVKRGFDRDGFYGKAEKTFDKISGYKRNYVETYQARKDFLKNSKLYFSVLLGMPKDEKSAAFKLIGKTGIPISNIPTNKVQLAVKAFKQLKKGIDVGVKSSSIGL